MESRLGGGGERTCYELGKKRWWRMRGGGDEWEQDQQGHHAGREEGGERGKRGGERTLMVVSSEDVMSVWPFWLNWQCSTVLVCPFRVARDFPEGISNT